ncbi:PREDICTED: probable transcription factor At1g11510 [Camelina sativa]|uniref:Probable transcription factor At1g11510 n=1 Tax=Camelina sativa TaxID=90675 RepID=A0ABM0XYQ8_CAMSA|nr:PREDICTED: probable transcription factor At1g11510 [Camelina sativa]
MSSKRFNPLEDPPSASSSDDDEVDAPLEEGDEIVGNSSSDEEEYDDDLPSEPPMKNVLFHPATTDKLVSDSESGSGEETESDTEPRKKKDQFLTVKHVTETKDSVAKDQDSKKVKTSEKSVGKRSRQTVDEGVVSSTKRVKKSVGGGGEETKKTYFQRVWTEDDEIAVLQGLMDYKKDTGVSPYDDTNGVYQLVKKSVSFDVSKIQFMEKLRSLKKKYENNVGKAKNGEEPSFAKPYDRKTFEFSKLVWGANGMALDSVVKPNGKSKKSSKSKKVESVKQEIDSSLPNGKNSEDEVTNKGGVSLLGVADMDVFAKSSLVKSLARVGVDELAADRGLSLLTSEDKKRIEEQWKALQVRELEFHSQKSGFIHDVVTKIGEAFRSNV